MQIKVPSTSGHSSHPNNWLGVKLSLICLTELDARTIVRNKSNTMARDEVRRPFKGLWQKQRGGTVLFPNVELAICRKLRGLSLSLMRSLISAAILIKPRAERELPLDAIGARSVELVRLVNFNSAQLSINHSLFLRYLLFIMLLLAEFPQRGAANTHKHTLISQWMLIEIKLSLDIFSL